MAMFANGRPLDDSPVPTNFNKDLNSDASNALFELEKGKWYKYFFSFYSSAIQATLILKPILFAIFVNNST